MLVLTRKLNEEICIGDNITLKVVAIADGQVKIGIAAPSSVRIYRAEIYKEVQKANVQAAGVSKSSAAKAAELFAKKSQTPQST
jgi:carbon storage regulator